MDTEVVAWIREEELGMLAMEIANDADKISEVFSKIDACMGKVSAYYSGAPSKKILQRYDELKANYPVMKENIVSYSEDLITLISKMRENDKYLASLFREYINETNDHTKVAENIIN